MCKQHVNEEGLGSLGKCSSFTNKQRVRSGDNKNRTHTSVIQPMNSCHGN